jgi:uncharacterized protein
VHWLIIARDGTDPDAPARRKAAREEHLAANRTLFEEGRVLYAGALLDADGGMIGSLLVVDAPDEATVRAQIEADAYTRGGVWVDVEVRGFRRAFP